LSAMWPVGGLRWSMVAMVNPVSILVIPGRAEREPQCAIAHCGISRFRVRR
jgi:hypothetical protein